MFSTMKLGTRITLFVIGIVLICMTTVALIIIDRSSKIQIDEAHKLAINASKRYANLVQGFFNEVFIGLKASKQTFEELLQSGYNDDQPIMEKSLVNLVDSSQWGNYAYLYIKDPSYTQHNIANPKHKLPNGEFLILVHDQNPNVDGGVEVLQADPSILNFGSVQKALTTKKPTVGIPTKQNIGNLGERMGVGMNFPIFDKAGNVQGVLGIFVDLDAIAPRLIDASLSVFEGDYRVLMNQSGVIGIHYNKEVLGKSIFNVNTDPTVKKIMEKIQNHEDGIFDFTNMRGEHGYAGVANFEVGQGLNEYWSVMIPIRTSAILASVDALRLMFYVGNLISYVILGIILSYYIRFRVVGRVRSISEQLFGFFKYLNHETQTPPPPLKPTAQDEIGAMAMAINENIEKTRKGLEQDSHVVKEVVYIVEEAKQGRFGGSVTQTSPNPQVEKLKTSLNEMSTTLRGLVGPDLGKAAAIFQAFEKNDFTQRLENPQGLEKGVNSLGDSICNMIRVSANFAKDLESKSKDLEEAVRTLTESSNTQASS
ncbi:methyl-accepting chemotaxis protein, partial [Helicobacter didelphidarum]